MTASDLTTVFSIGLGRLWRAGYFHAHPDGILLAPRFDEIRLEHRPDDEISTSEAGLAEVNLGDLPTDAVGGEQPEKDGQRMETAFSTDCQAGASTTFHSQMPTGATYQIGCLYQMTIARMSIVPMKITAPR